MHENLATTAAATTLHYTTRTKWIKSTLKRRRKEGSEEGKGKEIYEDEMSLLLQGDEVSKTLKLRR